MSFLYDYQLDAVRKMRNGCILNGTTGCGKSRTALYYYFMLQGGQWVGQSYTPMVNPKDLYIITTAKKRDEKEWDAELANYFIFSDPKENAEVYGYSNKVVIDSWNKIKAYKDVKGAFFIFDEDRVTGKGAWVKSFLNISKHNEWIILSATPGDCWADYIPVFIANGFYRNRTEFEARHIIFDPYVNYPKIKDYINQGRLVKYRRMILIDMDYKPPATQHHIDIWCDYDLAQYKAVFKDRWNVFEEKPIENASQLCYVLRKTVNSHWSRMAEVMDIIEKHGSVIIFYNYAYEVQLLRGLNYEYDFKIAEWNGEKHEPLPSEGKFVYLVQYRAGCEGWNCTTCNTMIFYSESYSYKDMFQAAGRIDRANTPYEDLYYYHLKSRSGIDLAVSKALSKKKNFNEKDFVEG